MNTKNADCQYEVLSPWAEADPIPLRGITDRVPDLAGKTVGLSRNSKRAAVPILTVVEEKLKARFPTLEVSYFASYEGEIEPMAGFEEWLKGVDAVILAYGD